MVCSEFDSKIIYYKEKNPSARFSGDRTVNYNDFIYLMMGIPKFYHLQEFSSFWGSSNGT